MLLTNTTIATRTSSTIPDAIAITTPLVRQDRSDNEGIEFSPINQYRRWNTPIKSILEHTHEAD